MAQVRLAPDALLLQSNLAGTLSAIIEDPDTGDTNWLTAPALQSAAAKTYYLLDTTADAGYSLQDGAPAPTPNYFHNAGSASGWNTGTVAPPRYGNLDYNTEVARTALVTSEPSGAIVTSAGAGNFFRTPNPLKGSFAAGNWTFSLALRSHTLANTADFLIKWRVWSTVDATGATGATQVTSGVISSNTVTATMSLTADTQTTATWTAPSFTLADEYLFFTCYIHVTVAGSGNNNDVNLRKGSTSNIATTAFTPAEPDTALRVSFPTPASVLSNGAGLQEFRALVRKKGTGTNPSATLSLYESGSLVSTVAGPSAVSSGTGTVISGTWDSVGRTAANIEALVSGAGAVGGSLEVGAIEWNATIADEQTITAGFLPTSGVQYPSQVAIPNVDTEVYVSFPAPMEPLITGFSVQEFRVLVRKKGSGANPTCVLKLYEGGVEKSTLTGSISVSSEQVISAVWNASLLANASGANVELKVIGTGAGGGTIEVGAIEWLAQSLPAPNFAGFVDSRPTLYGAQVGGDTQNTVAGLVSDTKMYAASLSPPYTQASFLGALTSGPYVPGEYPPPKDSAVVYGAGVAVGLPAQVVAAGLVAEEVSYGAQVETLFVVGNDLSLAWNVLGAGIYYARIAPDAIVSAEHLAGVVSAIQDDPDAADNTFLTAI